MINMTIVGNLTHNPEIGQTKDGVRYCRFTVAANRRNREEAAEFVQVTVWEALADLCAKYLGKGKKVACVGEPKSYAWMSRDGVPKARIEMSCREVEFHSAAPGSGDGAGTEARGAAVAPAAVDPGTGMAVVDPEDIPY